MVSKVFIISQIRMNHAHGCTRVVFESNTVYVCFCAVMVNMYPLLLYSLHKYIYISLLHVGGL